MSSPIGCVGILTSGGDCPGLNAVIRAAARSAERLSYGCVGFLRGYEGLVDPVSYLPLDARNIAGILTQGGTILGSTNKGRFSATVGEDQRVSIDPTLLDQVEATAASHERIMVLEVMGRHAGWIALHAGIAGGGDVVLLPEIPWTFENVCGKILRREAEGKRFTLVVVAEGADLPDKGLASPFAMAAAAVPRRQKPKNRPRTGKRRPVPVRPR